jgi:hypothetical protein
VRSRHEVERVNAAPNYSDGVGGYGARRPSYGRITMCPATRRSLPRSDGQDEAHELILLEVVGFLVPTLPVVVVVVPGLQWESNVDRAYFRAIIRPVRTAS